MLWLCCVQDNLQATFFWDTIHPSPGPQGGFFRCPRARAPWRWAQRPWLYFSTSTSEWTPGAKSTWRMMVPGNQEHRNHMRCKKGNSFLVNWSKVFFFRTKSDKDLIQGISMFFLPFCWSQSAVRVWYFYWLIPCLMSVSKGLVGFDCFLIDFNQTSLEISVTQVMWIL